MAYKQKEGLLTINTSYQSGYFNIDEIRSINFSKSWNEIHITDIDKNNHSFTNESNRDITLIFNELQSILYKLKTYQICNYVLDLKPELKEENGIEL